MGEEDKSDNENNDPSPKEDTNNASPKEDTNNVWTHGPLQGDLPLKVALKDVTAQKEDRLLIDALLDSSDGVEDEGLIGTLFCGDWRDAVKGWGLARPNVKYAWSEKTTKERRNKNVNHSKKKQQEVERSWKNKIEPLTYRYNPDCGTHARQAPDLVERRRVHPSLQHHIDKVREHLERTLMKQQVLGEMVQERKHLEPLPRIEPMKTNVVVDGGGDVHNSPAAKINSSTHKNGEYIVQMVQKARRHSLEGDGVVINSEMGDGDANFHRNGPGRLSDARLLQHGQKHHTWHRQYQEPLSNSNNNASVDLVTALGQKLNEILLEDKLKSLGGIPSLPRKIQKSHLFNSLASDSHELFPASDLAPMPGDQTLNPLTKVTPYQRQVHDDNEVTAITSSRPEKTGTANSTTSHMSSLFIFDEDDRDESANNNDLINMGISGQCVSSKSDKKQKQSTGQNTTTSSNSQQTGKKHRSSGSNKLHKLPLTHGKGESSEKTDDMHRGMMDREAAAAVAISLMPGVRGRNIEVPNV